MVLGHLLVKKLVRDCLPRIHYHLVEMIRSIRALDHRQALQHT